MHQADRSNPLVDLGPALYEPIRRQGTGNPEEVLDVWMEDYSIKHLG